MTKYITGLTPMKTVEYNTRLNTFASKYIWQYVWIIQPYIIDYAFILIYISSSN